MRLIATLNDQHNAYLFSSFLMRQGIENQLELISNTDWGSPDYGTATCRIWVYEEDQLEPALKYASEFQQNPQDPKFQDVSAKTLMPPQIFEHDKNTIQDNSPKPRQPIGAITSYLIILCSLLLVLLEMTSPTIPKKMPPNIPSMPVLFSPIGKSLVFDYPYAYELIDKIISLYGVESLNDPNTLPDEGKRLLTEFQNTPYWQGIYEQIVNKFKNSQSSWDFTAPLFEKIRQGQVWRVFTPCLLHSDIFHLFFNMIWLAVLGKQLEQRLRKTRYLLFILITAVFSNTTQYLMSGSSFMGFSGVLCGMFAFIWIRQRKTAWEGYQLDKGTMAFIAFFIFFMFALQLLSFFLEITTDTSLAIGIANTAHLTGALAGYVLGKSNFFAWRNT